MLVIIEIFPLLLWRQN